MLHRVLQVESKGGSQRQPRLQLRSQKDLEEECALKEHLSIPRPPWAPFRIFWQTPQEKDFAR